MLTPCSPRDSGLVWWVWHSGWEQVDTSCDHSPSGEAMRDSVLHTWHLATIQDDFQYYRNHRSNSWVSEGALHVMPTLTASEYGEDFLHNGCIDLNKEVSELSQPGTCHLSPWFHFFKISLKNLLKDPEHPCNIWYDKENLCSDCSGQDIVKPIQLARLHSKVSRNIVY